MASPTEQALTGSAAIGGLLILLGIVAYVLTDFSSATALIPAIFGLLFLGLALGGPRFGKETPALYGLGLLSVLAIAGSSRGIPDLLELLTGGSVDLPVAVAAQGAVILCSAFVVVLVARAVLATR